MICLDTCIRGIKFKKGKASNSKKKRRNDTSLVKINLKSLGTTANQPAGRAGLVEDLYQFKMNECMNALMCE